MQHGGRHYHPARELRLAEGIAHRSKFSHYAFSCRNTCHAILDVQPGRLLSPSLTDQRACADLVNTPLIYNGHWISQVAANTRLWLRAEKGEAIYKDTDAGQLTCSMNAVSAKMHEVLYLHQACSPSMEFQQHKRCASIKRHAAVLRFASRRKVPPDTCTRSCKLAALAGTVKSHDLIPGQASNK